MFGMTEKEFWEDDPQLYWSYQTFYLKKIEQEQELMNNDAWLKGIYTLSALNQALQGFTKHPKKDIYPKEPIKFGEIRENKKYTREEKNEIYVQEFNKWARL